MLFEYLSFRRADSVLVSGFRSARVVSEVRYLCDEAGEDLLYARKIGVGFALSQELRAALKSLRVMIGGGLRMARACQQLSEQKGAIGIIFHNITESLHNGVTLACAIKEHLFAIDPVLCGILSTNTQQNWLEFLSLGEEYLSYQIRMSGCLRTALYYPLVVTIIITCVAWFYACIVLSTTIGYVLAMTCTAVCSMLSYTILYPERFTFTEDYYYSSWFFAVHSVLCSGRSLQTAFEVTRGMFEDSKLSDACDKVLDGVSLREAFCDFPVVVVSMLSGAGQSDNVCEVFKGISDFYQMRVQSCVDWYLR